VPLIETTFPNASYVFVAVVTPYEETWVSAFLRLEKFQVEVEPLRSETPGV
jgi:hypothetical protein